MNAPFVVRPLKEGTEVDELLVAPSRERRRLQCYVALLIGDILSIILGCGVVGYLFAGKGGLAESLVHAQLILPIFLTVAFYNGSYSIVALLASWKGIFRATVAMVIAMVVVIFVQFLIQPGAGVSRAAFNGGGLVAMGIIAWSRLQLRSFVTWRCGPSVINELIIDDGGPQVNLRGAIRISAAAMGLRPDLNDPHSLDRLGLVLRNIDRVIVSCPAGRRANWAMMLKGANVDGEVLDDEVARLGAQGARVVGKHGLLLVSAGPLGLRDRAVKRLFDITFAGSAILALSPLLILVALAVKLQDGGPVFFMQRRMGRGNRFFNMYKFRSMTQALCDKDGNTSASKDDQRITKVGKFIRRTSIDELPQLFNVLLGDMSIVGPRPHATGSLAGDKLFWEVDLRYWQRHCLKPGLSGLAQVRGYRGATDHESDLINRLQSDLEYLEGWTIMRDIQIIVLTLRVLVHDRAF
ncbi:sugar transferase [Novosphingobium mangrovi (ex Huang et al. 2023)]|uniref:Sugar transferase n=1 Tax=Novosphingobium mangrovi (ex Huang et al. 2023) TaxID=2976432 RepID=A0ABT2I9U7_9SPHN|nr:sugar transferase [Novosphingobium mangrovi (ex Huang et al. 2023)]MCT2401603.1 sugar transferase [Novosphingobium mangrovi (ex Huang et al. 2023)]